MARLMSDHDLDIVLSASDAPLIAFSACAGWPVATAPGMTSRGVSSRSRGTGGWTCS